MKISNFKPGFILFYFLLITMAGHSEEPIRGDLQGFALVELYTSEGCSSCPPADALLRELTKLSRHDNTPIYLLGFHVDYWNKLGWIDRFSRPEFSQRQHKYAAAHKSDTVYTPQMIVNGREAFSGYRQDLAQKAINIHLHRPKSAEIRFEIADSSENIKAVYQLSGAWEGKTLYAAMVERGLQSQVTQGENAGKMLRHDNVVRFYSSQNPDAAIGELEIQVPEDLNRSQASVILFIQDPLTMEILGARQKNLPS